MAVIVNDVTNRGTTRLVRYLLPIRQAFSQPFDYRCINREERRTLFQPKHQCIGTVHRQRTPAFSLGSWQTAALFIHGFMGTLAEFRPVAHELHQTGWTVQGLLLLGFGKQIDTLFDRHYQEWLEAAQSALIKLKKNHYPILLVGYSMGAAVALIVAAGSSPDKLILLAPFLRIGNMFHHIIWQVVKHLFPNPQPFKKANFSDARIGEFLGGLIPKLDLEDRLVQDNLRQMRVPANFVDQVLGVGRAAEKAATQIHIPTLIIQGTHDQAVNPARTRKLVQRLPGPITYQELNTDHDLVNVAHPSFQTMNRSILTFAQNADTGYPANK